MKRLERGSRRPGSTRWSLQAVHFVALMMVWEADSVLQDRFRSARDHFVEMFPRGRRPGKSYQGFVKAQAKISPAMKRHLLDHLGRHHQRIARNAWQWRGWTAFACDGSRIEAPRTARNQRALGRAGRKKTGPQLFVTILYHMGTGLPWNWTIGKGTASERDHLRSMLAALPPGSLIVADGGFVGYELMTAIVAQGHSFLIRAGSNVRLLTHLDGRSQAGGRRHWLWPNKQRPRPPMRLRLIRVGKVCLLTNVLESSALSKRTAGEFYRLRWGVEVLFRSYKQTLERRRLRSRSPQTARAELHWGLIALLLLGLMSLERRPRRAHPAAHSIAGALRIIRHALRTTAAWRRQGNLLDLLKHARHDDYVRLRPKRSRHYPRKKTEAPAGSPTIRRATAKEKQAAQRFQRAA